MFENTFKVNFKTSKKLIDAADLLPERVETTSNKTYDFDAVKMIDSLVKETGLERKLANDIILNVLRLLTSLNLKTIAAPHLRELICQELTKRGLHEYRNKYTRLGLPVFDIIELLSSNKSDSFKKEYIILRIFEEYLHLTGKSKYYMNIIDMMMKDIFSFSISKDEQEELAFMFKNFKRLWDEKYNV